MQGQEVEELCGPKVGEVQEVRRLQVEGRGVQGQESLQTQQEGVQEVRRLQVEEQEMQGQEGQAGSPSCPAERRGSVVQ